MENNEFIDEFNKSITKVTFGLQPSHIRIIEKHLAKFPRAIYSTHVWQDIGKEIGWCPLTAALYYFEIKTQTNGK